jgi:hypothetical protein
MPFDAAVCSYDAVMACIGSGFHLYLKVPETDPWGLLWLPALGIRLARKADDLAPSVQRFQCAMSERRVVFLLEHSGYPFELETMIKRTYRGLKFLIITINIIGHNEACPLYNWEISSPVVYR